MSDRLLKESDVLQIAFQLPYVVISAFADAVKALPSADKPQGEWIIEIDANGYTYGRCSICGMRQYAGQLNFCPDCGAKMKGADDEISCR